MTSVSIDPHRPIAAIDIGSNSIHLTLARMRGDDIETLARFKDPARLAGTLDREGLLPEAVIDKAIATLRRFADLAQIHNAEIRANATATLRAAKNADLFIERAQKEAGIPVHIISGHEEARLTYRGVQFGLKKPGSTLLCVDVGGGSSELVIGKDDQISLTATFKIGSLLAATRLIGPDPVTPKSIHRARSAINALFENQLQTVAALHFDCSIATAGTIQRVIRIAQSLKGATSVSNDVHGHKLSTSDLDLVVARLSQARTKAERLLIPGMDPERTDSLLGGALIFQILSKRLHIDEWTVSMSALRTGLILDIYHHRMAQNAL